MWPTNIQTSTQVERQRFIEETRAAQAPTPPIIYHPRPYSRASKRALIRLYLRMRENASEKRGLLQAFLLSSAMYSRLTLFVVVLCQRGRKTIQARPIVVATIVVERLFPLRGGPAQKCLPILLEFHQRHSIPTRGLGQMNRDQDNLSYPGIVGEMDQ
jgi:hypothetical protein